LIVVWGRVGYHLLPSQSSKTPPSSLSIDLESQLPETQAQPSLILNHEISQNPETQPLHYTSINLEILLQRAQTQAHQQPHSAMETELLYLPSIHKKSIRSFLSKPF